MMKTILFLTVGISIVFSHTTNAAGEKCPYVFTPDSKITVINYGAFNASELTDRLVNQLDEKRGYALVKPEAQEVKPQYSFNYVIEADGNARRVNPAITLVYRNQDETKTRVIMKSKRVREDDQRLSAIEGLIHSAVKEVPQCPTWRH